MQICRNFTMQRSDLHTEALRCSGATQWPQDVSATLRLFIVGSRRPVLAGREPSPSPARGLPGRLRRHGDREETQSRSRQGRGHRGLPSPAAGPASPIGALRGDVTRAPGSRLAAAAARLSRPPPRPRPPRRRRGRPCTLAPGIAMCSQLRGRPRLPAVSPRSDSASAARARPRRLPSASPGLRRRRLGLPVLPRAGGSSGPRLPP